MKIEQTPNFRRAYKKLHPNQVPAVNNAIRHIADNPETGEMKRGDLAGIRVYKFKIQSQLFLLAYEIEADEKVILLMALGVHENFYRDVKN
ncbi:MAG TPA: type II toxin-antitoxin system RelE/ParE family toxin [Methylomusa anaerophila]|nr:type II toxin-antitoxin system RelE/ParE family toxin [Methylomusa anaerophila]HML89542.1 type II toxin-antitoxin system RelE/ParE family toxin [Methylomusa anaerophila]